MVGSIDQLITRCLHQIDVFPVCAFVADVFGTRQCDQLRYQPRRSIGRAADVFQTFLPLQWIFGVQRQLGLSFQSGQRRFDLMRGVGQKAFLQTDVAPQATENIVKTAHQRLHFLRCVIQRQIAQIVFIALQHAHLQAIERHDPARQAKPNQHHRNRQKHQLRQGHTLQNLSRQRAALVQRFTDLQQHQGIGRKFHRERRMGVQLQPHIRHAVGFAINFGIVKLHAVQLNRVKQRRLRQLRPAFNRHAIGGDELKHPLVRAIIGHHMPRRADLLSVHTLLQQLDLIVQTLIEG